MLSARGSILLLAPLMAAASASCQIAEPPSNGTCTPNAALACNTIMAGNPDAGVPSGLVGFSCTGTARPDEQDAKYIAGLPQGMICAEQGANADGTYGFCCTPPDQPTSCAYDPVRTTTCPDNNYAFQCRGADRPEALNPNLTCGNGIRDNLLVDYCCAASPRPAGCTEAKGACTGGLTGWHCPLGQGRPRGEDFGSNESRADYYYFVCGVPAVAGDQSSTYCCFTPSPLLPGGACVTAANMQNIQTYLPGCTTNRFAFACYGRETPEDDYLPIYCNAPPVDGVDDNGYPAKMYCCDYRKTNGLACSTGDECLSDDCTEGVCCALATCPSCYSCNVPGVPGTCRLVPAGGADPTGTCATCDGMGGCQ